MNWTTNLAIDLQRPTSHQPAPRSVRQHRKPGAIQTPWGWSSKRQPRQKPQTKHALAKSNVVPFRKTPITKSNMSGFVKPWGW